MSTSTVLRRGEAGSATPASPTEGAPKWPWDWPEKPCVLPGIRFDSGTLRGLRLLGPARPVGLAGDLTAPLRRQLLGPGLPALPARHYSERFGLGLGRGLGHHGSGQGVHVPRLRCLPRHATTLPVSF